MKLSINFRNMRGTADIIHHVDHRMSYAFSRMKNEIESMTVILSDTRKARRGVGKQCKIVIKPVGLRRIVMTEFREDIRQAIDWCFARCSQRLDRKLKRRSLVIRKKLMAEGSLIIRPQLT